MQTDNNDLVDEISVTKQEIEEWIDREAPHISNLRSRRKYYAKYWNVVWLTRHITSRSKYIFKNTQVNLRDHLELLYHLQF